MKKAKKDSSSFYSKNPDFRKKFKSIFSVINIIGLRKCRYEILYNLFEKNFCSNLLNIENLHSIKSDSSYNVPKNKKISKNKLIKNQIFIDNIDSHSKQSCFLKDTTNLAISNKNCLIKIYDYATKQFKVFLKGHKLDIMKITNHPVIPNFLLTCDPKTSIFWKLNTKGNKNLVFSILHSKNLRNVQFRKYGRIIDYFTEDNKWCSYDNEAMDWTSSLNFKEKIFFFSSNRSSSLFSLTAKENILIFDERINKEVLKIYLKIPLSCSPDWDYNGNSIFSANLKNKLKIFDLRNLKSCNISNTFNEEICQITSSKNSKFYMINFNHKKIKFYCSEKKKKNLSIKYCEKFKELTSSYNGDSFYVNFYNNGLIFDL